MEPVYTIGHSTRTIGELIDLLREHDVRTLLDVRRYPGSRRYPQYGKEALSASLARAGITYMHVEALGGRRTPCDDSSNDFWHNSQFRGYADHMATAEFNTALQDVIERARDQRVAIMCAEAVPWRCHRQLTADALVASRARVIHILQPGKVLEHQLHSNACVLAGGRVIYPAPDTQLDLL